MNTTKTFLPTKVSSEQNYDSLRLTDEEHRTLAASGHRYWTTLPQPTVTETLKRLGFAD